MSVRITSNLDTWLGKFSNQLDGRVLEISTDIDRVAKMNAPKLTRALVNSAKIERKKQAHYTITFGNTEVPYARRRHYENKKNPHTLRYLERAAEDITRNLNSYFKGL